MKYFISYKNYLLFLAIITVSIDALRHNFQMLNKISSATLTVKDLSQSLSFYTTSLNFEVQKSAKDNAQLIYKETQNDGIILNLQEDKNIERGDVRH